MTEDWRNGGFGLYLHWPFCAVEVPLLRISTAMWPRKSTKTAGTEPSLAEIERVGAETKDRVLNSVFFGGGTPSLMDPALVAAILDKVRTTWRLANDIEITLEANPSSIESGRFRAYSEAGVNRVSMGMQALNDADLRRLGRLHSVAEGRRAFDIARSVFDRVSFDLIYARQDQPLDAWRAELTEALSMAIDHLSLYQLTIEDGTAFGARHAAGKLRGLPEDEAAADMYLLTQEICDAHGMPAYEVSNHARAGAESRHNLIYWRYGDYAGIGPGAHGRLTLNGARQATDTPKAPNAWLEAVESLGTGELPRAALPRDEQAIEYLLFGLRLAEGISADRYRALWGQDLPQDRLEYLSDLGMIQVDQGRISATKAGMPVLNAILRELMP